MVEVPMVEVTAEDQDLDASGGDPRITQQQLTVEEVAGHPGQRLVRVGYRLVTGPEDQIVGRRAQWHVVIRGIELGHDPVSASEEPIVELTGSFLAQVGDQHHRVEQVVHRVLLDVEQDWWSTGNGGETVPIAEWPDHLVASIRIEVDDAVVAEALTPVVNGSWVRWGIVDRHHRT